MHLCALCFECICMEGRCDQKNMGPVLNVWRRLRFFPRLLCQFKIHTNICFRAEHFWSTNFYFLDVWSCREIKSGAKQNCWICVAVGVRGGAHHTIPCVRCVCVCVCAWRSPPYHTMRAPTTKNSWRASGRIPARGGAGFVLVAGQH